MTRTQLSISILNTLKELPIHERTALSGLLMDGGGNVKVHPYTLYRWLNANHPLLTLPHNIETIKSFLGVNEKSIITESVEVSKETHLHE